MYIAAVLVMLTVAVFFWGYKDRRISVPIPPEAVPSRFPEKPEPAPHEN